MEELISWQEAIARVASSAKPETSEEIPVRHSLDYYTSKEITIDAPYPPFHIAHIKGYAVNFTHIKERLNKGEFPVRIKVEGGVSPSLLKERDPHLSKAYKVNVGTALPEWLDAVVAEEDASLDGPYLVLSEEVRQFAGLTPAGSVFGESLSRINANQKITYQEFALLVTHGLEKIEAWKKPLVGVQAFGNALTDSQSDSLPRGKIRDIVIPIFRALAEKSGCLFIPLGVVENFSCEAIDNAFMQADVVIACGFIGENEWLSLVRHLSERLKVLVKGVRHPLGKWLICACAGEKWFFFIPYAPSFFLAVYSLLLHPTLTALKGETKSPFSLKNGRLMEDKEEEVKEDNLWIGIEGKHFAETGEAEIKLIAQISKASLQLVKEGDVFAITSGQQTLHARGESLSYAPYAPALTED